VQEKRSRSFSQAKNQFECGAADPLAGGQGALDDVPGVVEVPGVVDEPEFGDPEFGVELLVGPGAAPGIFPHGPPLGLV
jgi:hypothetical protein